MGKTLSSEGVTVMARGREVALALCGATVLLAYFGARGEKVLSQ